MRNLIITITSLDSINIILIPEHERTQNKPKQIFELQPNEKHTCVLGCYGVLYPGQQATSFVAKWPASVLLIHRIRGALQHVLHHDVSKSAGYNGIPIICCSKGFQWRSSTFSESGIGVCSRFAWLACWHHLHSEDCHHLRLSNTSSSWTLGTSRNWKWRDPAYHGPCMFLLKTTWVLEVTAHKQLEHHSLICTIRLMI